MTSSYSKSFIDVAQEIKNLALKDRRRKYRCYDKFVTLTDIPTIKELQINKKLYVKSNYKGQKITDGKYVPKMTLNDKISVFSGNIVTLEIDAIVNAANKSLLGGGGVDAAIHSAAGNYMMDECRTLNGCNTGDAKITFGYNLPAKNVIHTVGPMGENAPLLESCYRKSLELAVERNLKTVAFPCISTGVYGYPNENAAQVALNTVRIYLESNPNNFDRIIFTLFLDKDRYIYEQLIPLYFPPDTTNDDQ